MAEKSVLPPLWKVPQEFRNRLGEQAGRQRVMFCDGHLLLVLHRPPKEDEVQRKGRFFWRSPDGTWTSSELSVTVVAALSYCSLNSASVYASRLFGLIRLYMVT